MERREFMGKQQKTTDRQIPKKKRRKASRFHMALALFIAIVAVSGALAFMLLMLPGNGEASAEKPAVFGVHDIQVVGGDYRRERHPDWAEPLFGQQSQGSR